MIMIPSAIALVAAPFAAFVLIAFVTRKAPTLSALIAILAGGASLALSVGNLAGVIGGAATAGAATTGALPGAFAGAHASIPWLSIPSVGRFRGLELAMGVLVDPLSATMCVIVSLVAFLVTVYSLGYMKGDPGFSRYFAYLSLFAFSMLGLVVADNYFQTFVFWELVGLSSYLLIGFWFEKPSAADASRKAFVTNRWADFGFMTGTSFSCSPSSAPLILAKLSTAIAGRAGAAPCSRSLPPHLCWPSWQIRAVPLPRVASRRYGGPHPGERADPRGHHGGRRRVPHCARLRAVCKRACGDGDHGVRRRLHRVLCRINRARAEGHQAHPGLLHAQPVGLHVHGTRRGQHERGHVPPDHPRIFQGPPLPGGRERHPRHGRAGHLQDGRARREDEDHRRDVRHRGPCAFRGVPASRLLEQGRDPSCIARLGAHRALCPRSRCCLHDSVLHVPAHFHCFRRQDR